MYFNFDNLLFFSVVFNLFEKTPTLDLPLRWYRKEETTVKNSRDLAVSCSTYRVIKKRMIKYTLSDDGLKQDFLSRSSVVLFNE